MIELNPCPSCGREPQIREMDNCFIVECGDCNNLTQSRAVSASGAINAWNEATGGRQNSKTLRDGLAMAALTGLLASDTHTEWTTKGVCARAYEIADAMIKERGK